MPAFQEVTTLSQHKIKLPEFSSRVGALLVAVIVALGLTAPAFSQTVSRVGVTVKDEAGNPLQGVTVTAVHEPTNFKVERTTNKKGKATLAFKNGALTYQVTLSMEGFDPASTSLKPVTGASSYQTYTLYKTNSRQAVPSGGEGGTREIPLTPAQKVFNEGVTALQAEDLDVAEAKFLQALEMDPELYQTHSALAAIYLERKEFAKAKASAEVMVEKEPGSGRGYRMLYEALSGLGEQEAADELVAKISALESSADAVPLIYNEGAEAARLGDMPRAQERLEKALSLDPELNQAVRLLAIVYLNQKDFAKAAEFSERYLVGSPDDVTMMKLRVDAYNGLGNKAKADEAFQQLAEANPESLISGMFEAGQKEFNAGNTATALATFSKILEINPEHGMTHYLIGLAYTNQGDNAKAKEHLQTFVKLMPEHENAKLAQEMIGFL